MVLERQTNKAVDRCFYSEMGRGRSPSEVRNGLEGFRGGKPHKQAPEEVPKGSTGDGSYTPGSSKSEAKRQMQLVWGDGGGGVESLCWTMAWEIGKEEDCERRSTKRQPVVFIPHTWQEMLQ